jgi:hypothetical protein
MMPSFDIDGPRVEAMVDDVGGMSKTQPVPATLIRGAKNARRMFHLWRFGQGAANVNGARAMAASEPSVTMRTHWSAQDRRNFVL